jgi:hypothetical protein
LKAITIATNRWYVYHSQMGLWHCCTHIKPLYAINWPHFPHYIQWYSHDLLMVQSHYSFPIFESFYHCRFCRGSWVASRTSPWRRSSSAKRWRCTAPRHSHLVGHTPSYIWNIYIKIIFYIIYYIWYVIYYILYIIYIIYYIYYILYII